MTLELKCLVVRIPAKLVVAVPPTRHQHQGHPTLRLPDKMTFAQSFTCGKFISCSQFSQSNFCQDFASAFCEPLMWVLGIPLGAHTSVSFLFACVMAGAFPQNATQKEATQCGTWAKPSSPNEKKWRIKDKFGNCCHCQIEHDDLGLSLLPLGGAFLPNSGWRPTHNPLHCAATTHVPKMLQANTPQ